MTLDWQTRLKKSTSCLFIWVLSNYEHFSSTLGGFYTNDVYYSDTDSLYIENEHWDKLDKTGLVGKNRLKGKNDYK